MGNAYKRRVRPDGGHPERCVHPIVDVYVATQLRGDGGEDELVEKPEYLS